MASQHAGAELEPRRIRRRGRRGTFAAMQRNAEASAWKSPVTGGPSPCLTVRWPSRSHTIVRVRFVAST